MVVYILCKLTSAHLVYALLFNAVASTCCILQLLLAECSIRLGCMREDPALSPSILIDRKSKNGITHAAVMMKLDKSIISVSLKQKTQQHMKTNTSGVTRVNAT